MQVSGSASMDDACILSARPGRFQLPLERVLRPEYFVTRPAVGDEDPFSVPLHRCASACVGTSVRAAMRFSVAPGRSPSTLLYLPRPPPRPLGRPLLPGPAETVAAANPASPARRIFLGLLSDKSLYHCRSELTFKLDSVNSPGNANATVSRSSSVRVQRIE